MSGASDIVTQLWGGKHEGAQTQKETTSTFAYVPAPCNFATIACARGQDFKHNTQLSIQHHAQHVGTLICAQF